MRPVVVADVRRAGAWARWWPTTSSTHWLNRSAAPLQGERTVNPSVRHTIQDYVAGPDVARPIGREGAPMRAADSLP